MSEIADKEHKQAAQTLRELMSAYRENEDLIAIGAYRRGSNKMVDAAIDMQEEINGFLRQSVDHGSNVAESKKALLALQQALVSRLKATATPGGKA